MTLRNLVPTLEKKRVSPSRDYSPLRPFNEDFDRLFDSFFRGFEIVPFMSDDRSFRPDIAFSENDKEINLSTELPGIDEKDIDVSLKGNTLTISGEKKEQKEVSSRDYRLKERCHGLFTRSIPLCGDIDAGKVTARFKKGVLKITLPKSEKEIEKKKKISVHVD